MTDNKTFLFEERDDTVIITPQINLGEMEYSRIETDGKAVLEQFSASDAKHVVVNLEKTDFLGSSALGFLVRVWNRCRSIGGHMAFFNVSAHQKTILDLTRLDTLWSMCDTQEAAIAAVHEADGNS